MGRFKVYIRELGLDKIRYKPRRRDSLAFHNIFPFNDMAEKAAEYMRRSNAIIRACLLVDPDFVPKWGKENYFPCYHVTDGWIVSAWFDERKTSTCSVSTEEKCKQVCALLTKWGVR